MRRHYVFAALVIAVLAGDAQAQIFRSRGPRYYSGPSVQTYYPGTQAAVQTMVPGTVVQGTVPAAIPVPATGGTVAVQSTVPPAAMPPAAVVGGQATTTNPDQWRYVQHGNQMWYYTPQNSWMTWSGSSWAPYNAAATTYGVPQSSGYRGYNVSPYGNAYGNANGNAYVPGAAAGANLGAGGGGAVGGNTGANIGAGVGGAIGGNTGANIGAGVGGAIGAGS